MENLPKITDYKPGDILIPNKFDGTNYRISHDFLKNHKYVTLKSLHPHIVTAEPKTNNCGFTIIVEEFPYSPFDPRFFKENVGQCPVVKLFYHTCQKLNQLDPIE